MLKIRGFCLVIAVCLGMILLSAACLAETSQMQITNCEEWVSLREHEFSSSDRLAKVPYNATVTNCSPAMNGFIRCTYNGITGYIPQKYLVLVDEDEALYTYDEIFSLGYDSSPIIERRGDYTVVITMSYAENETLRIGCFDAEMKPVWSYTTASLEETMLDVTDAFVGGTEDRPLVYVYNLHQGVDENKREESLPHPSSFETDNIAKPDVLTALDFYTGEVVWSLSAEETGLTSGGIVHACDDYGKLYIGEYSGIDPIVITADGEIISRTASGNDSIFWLYEITSESGKMVCKYESGLDGSMGTETYHEVTYTISQEAFDPGVPLDEMVITTQYYYSSGPHSCYSTLYSAFDLRAREKNVYAVADGEVIVSEFSTTSRFGNFIIIKHTLYNESGEEKYIYSLYAHLKERHVQKGDMVKKGENIAISGNSSKDQPMDHHLHFELFEADANKSSSTKSGNIWPVYHAKDLRYTQQVVVVNGNKNDPISQTFSKYIKEHYELKNDLYVRKENSPIPKMDSFASNLYTSNEKVVVIEGYIYPSRIDLVVGDMRITKKTAENDTASFEVVSSKTGMEAVSGIDILDSELKQELSPEILNATESLRMSISTSDQEIILEMARVFSAVTDAAEELLSGTGYKVIPLGEAYAQADPNTKYRIDSLFVGMANIIIEEALVPGTGYSLDSMYETVDLLDGMPLEEVALIGSVFDELAKTLNQGS